jgi:hypothetical protein
VLYEVRSYCSKRCSSALFHVCPATKTVTSLTVRPVQNRANRSYSSLLTIGRLGISISNGLWLSVCVAPSPPSLVTDPPLPTSQRFESPIPHLPHPHSAVSNGLSTNGDLIALTPHPLTPSQASPLALALGSSPSCSLTPCSCSCTRLLRPTAWVGVVPPYSWIAPYCLPGPPRIASSRNHPTTACAGFTLPPLDPNPRSTNNLRQARYRVLRVPRQS